MCYIIIGNWYVNFLIKQKNHLHQVVASHMYGGGGSWLCKTTIRRSVMIRMLEEVN